MNDPVDRTGDIKVADNKFTPLKEIFVQEMRFKDGRVYPRHVFPKTKQWLYVKYLFQGIPQRAAYLKAGYKFCNVSNTRLDHYVRTVHNSKHVQLLINGAIGDYLKRRELSVQRLVDEALRIYDRCDTVSEQLATLKFINTLLPKGYKGQCSLKTCPLRRRKK